MSTIPAPGHATIPMPSSTAQAQYGQQRLDAQGGVDLNIPVRAVNRSDQPVTWEYARQKYVLPPNVAVYVPYEAMVYWQGDPRAIDMPGGKLNEQFRRLQRDHLRALYGVYENDERWATIPLVECYPIDSDLRFETVLLDPDGVSVSSEAASANETEFLRNQLASMQQQVAILAAQVNAQDQANAALDAAGLTPEDMGSQVTTSRAVAPEHSMLPPQPERRSTPVVKKGAASGPVSKKAAVVGKDE